MMPIRTGNEKRAQLYALLGDLPPRDRHVSGEMIAQENRDGYVLEKLVLDLNGVEMVPAYFVRPSEGSGPWPAVLYNHAHGGDYVLGKDELLLGRGALQEPTPGAALCRRADQTRVLRAVH